MTNKLPVIGKRYKVIIPYLTRDEQLKLGDIITPDSLGTFPNGKHFINVQKGLIPLEIFSIFCEELPDQEPTTEESSTTGKVQEALRELKIELKEIESFISCYGYNKYLDQFYNKTQNLVNALESSMYTKPNNMPIEQQNIQETPVSSIVEHTSKSIWKPISELPARFGHVLVKVHYQTAALFRDHLFLAYYGFKDKEISFFVSRIEKPSKLDCDEVSEWCFLSDFINHQESLEKRIENLEVKQDKPEGEE
jgi:hypothetical protein